MGRKETKKSWFSQQHMEELHLLDLRRATSESRGEQSLWSFARPNSQLGKLFKFLHVLLYRVPTFP
jgi:hypothetical protein